MDDLEWLNQFKAEYRQRYPLAVSNGYMDSIAESLSKLDQLEKHRERAYEDVANISVENHELRSRLDSVRCLLAKWEPMANSASDHEAGAALTCIDDLKAVLVEKRLLKS